MHYICYTCQTEFESDKLLIGRAEVVGACPCQNPRAPEKPAPGEDDWQYSRARTREVQRARRYNGELITWVQQGTNPGFVKNKKLVARHDEKGVYDVDGVCRTIVAGFCWRMLTLPHIAALNTFGKEMRSIPREYLEYQKKHKEVVDERNGHVEAISKLEKERDDFRDPRREHEPFYQLMMRSADADIARHESALALVPDEGQTGFGFSLTTETTEREIRAANVQRTLNAVLESRGIYHVRLKLGDGSNIGHAIAFWNGSIRAERSRFGSTSSPMRIFLFMDPNTGVYAFKDEGDLGFFMKEYWPIWLGVFTGSPGRALKYRTGLDEKDEKRKKEAEKSRAADKEEENDRDEYYFV